MTDSNMSLTLKSGKDSKSELSLISTEDEVMVSFWDQKGLIRGAVSMHSAGMDVGFTDAKGAEKGTLRFTGEGNGGLKLYDASGKLVWKAP